MHQRSQSIELYTVGNWSAGHARGMLCMTEESEARECIRLGGSEERTVINLPRRTYTTL